MEAYTNLFRVFPNKKIGKALGYLIECFSDKFIGVKTKHLNLVFDEEWNSKSKAISYGHDIECSWLLQEAAEVLGDENFLKKVKVIAFEMVQVTLENGFDSTGGIMYEKENNHFEQEKHWWVQAEVLIGFFNAYEFSNEEKYLEASFNCWIFIQKNISDKGLGKE